MDFAKPGDTNYIRVQLYDGADAITSKVISVYIEKLSTGQYWDGSSWTSNPTALTMTEKTTGTSVHYDGVYEYQFTPPSTETDVYDWSVTFEDDTGGTAYRRKFRGQISTNWDHWLKGVTEPTGVPSATDTPMSILAFLLAILRNKVEVTATSLKVYKDDGTTLIASSTLSDDGTTLIKGEFT